MVAVLEAYRDARTGGARKGRDSGSASDSTDIHEFVDKVFSESDRDSSGTLSLLCAYQCGTVSRARDFSAGDEALEHQAAAWQANRCAMKFKDVIIAVPVPFSTEPRLLASSRPVSFCLVSFVPVCLWTTLCVLQ